MVKLHVSEEATWLHEFVEDSLARFKEEAMEKHAKKSKGRGKELARQDSRADGRSAGGGETEFMCAHIRRQDFEESCARYEEEFRSGRYASVGSSAFGVEVYAEHVTCVRLDRQTCVLRIFP